MAKDKNGKNIKLHDIVRIEFEVEEINKYGKDRILTLLARRPEGAEGIYLPLICSNSKLVTKLHTHKLPKFKDIIGLYSDKPVGQKRNRRILKKEDEK